MIDIKFLRENPEIVKQNIKNKFQEKKLPLVDEVIELDKQARAAKGEADALRANRNKISKEIGGCYARGEREKAEELKAKAASLGVKGPYTSWRHMFGWNTLGLLLFGPAVATHRFFDTLNKTERELNKQ